MKDADTGSGPSVRRSAGAGAPDRPAGEDGGMVAGVVIHTLPGRAAAVTRRLAAVPGLDPRGDDGDARLAAVWSGPDAESLRALAEALVADDEEILGIYPTFAADV